MKLKLGGVILLLWTILFAKVAISQSNSKFPNVTADSLKSGNYKDVFLSFFQLAFENLAGPKKELRFAANPYAVMMRADPSLAIDTNYLRYTSLRRLNFAFALRVDTGFKFNGFASEVKYSLLDKRDYTIHREFLDLVKKRTLEYRKMQDAVDGVVGQLRIDGNEVLSKKLDTQWRQLTQASQFTLDKVDESVRNILDSIAKADKLTEFAKFLQGKQKINIRQRLDDVYNDEKNLFLTRPLWTIKIADTTYKDQFFFSNLVFSSQFLKGFTKRAGQNGFELNLNADYNLVDDTARAGKDLKRNIFNFKGTLNYVRRYKKTNLSFFELDAGASYKKIFNGNYTNEQKEMFLLSGIIRFRIYEEIWIPLEFVYNPKTGNIFGFLNVRVNFSMLKDYIAKNPGAGNIIKPIK